MTAAECGDEPRLLARSLPVIVSRDRLAGARLAEREGATLVLLDDGLQNPRLARIAPSRSWMPGNASATASACLPAAAGPCRGADALC